MSIISTSNNINNSNSATIGTQLENASDRKLQRKELAWALEKCTAEAAVRLKELQTLMEQLSPIKDGIDAGQLQELPLGKAVEGVNQITGKLNELNPILDKMSLFLSLPLPGIGRESNIRSFSSQLNQKLHGDLGNA